MAGAGPHARRREPPCRRCPRSSPPSRRSARPSCRPSSPAGSTRSTRPGAGRCSSSSPARCASACRRGSPRPRSRRSATREPDEVELVWPSLTPPYADLFAWLEGRAARPATADPAPFRPPMLSHAIEETDFASLDPADFVAEWKWDGIRVQAAAGRLADGRRIARLYSRTGEDISGAFPDLAEALDFDGALDGELLIMREGRVQSFNVLQQRLNRKTVSAKLLAEFPAHLRAYDLLVEGEQDLRDAALRRAAGAARGLRRAARFAAHRPLAAGAVCELGRARRGPRRSRPCRRRRGCRGGRRRDDQAARLALPAGPAEGPVVEVEARSLHDRCRADVRAARPRQALVLLFGLHLRRLDRGRGRRRARARSARPISASPMPSSPRSTASSAATPSAGSARCARSPMRATKAWCSRSRSKGCSARPGTSPASPCGFPRISRLRWDKPPRDADRLETLMALLGPASAETPAKVAPPSFCRPAMW